MSATRTTTADLQRWVDLLHAGRPEAQAGLLNRACDRLRLLTRAMLGGFPTVRTQEQTDDVLNGSLVRLHATLAEVRPESLRHFFNLAGQAIRRELIDVARRLNRGDGRRVVLMPDDATALHPPVRDGCPVTLASWGEFHEAVEALPDDEREVTTLLWYEELSQSEAAAVLGVSERTVLRRWHAARLKLAKVVADDTDR
jgi:RNA polymerase sigma-70 factor (ECF subfamily)